MTTFIAGFFFALFVLWLIYMYCCLTGLGGPKF